MFDDTVYIMSGIIDTREQDVLNAITDTFEIIERKEEKAGSPWRQSLRSSFLKKERAWLMLANISGIELSIAVVLSILGIVWIVLAVLQPSR